MVTGILKSALCLLLVFIIKISFSQGHTTKADIERALADDQPGKADSLLQRQVAYYFSSGQLDSLPAYAGYVGRVAEKKEGPEEAIQQVSHFIARLKSNMATTAILANAYSFAGEFYGALGKNELAYKTNEQAYALAAVTPGPDPSKLASIHSDLGTYAYRMGNINLAQVHHRQAIKVFLKAKHPDYDRLYVAANNMGAVMWFASKMDSAIYYFTVALQALSRTENTPLNQYYRPAVLQNNMAALYNMQGKTTEAIAAMKATIENLKTYLSIKEAGPKKETAVPFQFEATDNLAGIYKELGDYSRAYELLQYSYQQKQKLGGADRTGVFKSEILLGQLYLAMKEHDKARDYLQRGLEQISRADGDYLFWQADACQSLATLFDERGEVQVAYRFYGKADSLYEASLQGEYDDIYLQFLRNAAVFYARNGQVPLALKQANKALGYITRTQGTKTQLAFYQFLNLGEIYFIAGDYKKARDYAVKGLAVIAHIVAPGSPLLDSIKTELEKPKAILLKAKADYRLLPEKNVSALTSLLADLNQALSVLEKRRTVIQDSKDISLLMADHADLLDFVKTVTLELHRLTQDQGYIDKLIEFHESGIYNRIRSRLDKGDSLQFAHVPAAIQEKERQIKDQIKASLEEGLSHSESMRRYFAAIDQWNTYQEMVKKQYPQYYEMRYASIFRPLTGVQQSLRAGISLVRYFFVGKELFALVTDRQQKQLVPLHAEGLDKNIPLLTETSLDAVETGEILYTLYRQLWMPLEQYIHHSKIVIIPDGILYNLSFEILTPRKISDFEELASSGLLADHSISYHYSLYLAGQRKQAVASNKGFVAFAPGFLDEEKNRYRLRVRDSLDLDRSYISLLPQPFTIDFVDRARRMLGGDTYVKDQSTAASFKANAGHHQVIHIGTHAESNNLSPEFSRLIFSKSDVDRSGSNSIFLYELYNCDLNSELAVLTACESGKPGFEDGEGMISLAHAFNYAGSESILTGLWKIDEKASALLIEEFYKNLLEGMEKDEALRQAKISYLKRAKGRMLAPAYWAGLILMGDTSPVQLTKPMNATPWIIAGVVLCLLIVLFFVYKNRKRALA